jgi:hypothetical protein
MLSLEIARERGAEAKNGVVEARAGALTVDSQLGQGTRFESIASGGPTATPSWRIT